jgi:hypothetical protein
MSSVHRQARAQATVQPSAVPAPFAEACLSVYSAERSCVHEPLLHLLNADELCSTLLSPVFVPGSAAHRTGMCFHMQASISGSLFVCVACLQSS